MPKRSDKARKLRSKWIYIVFIVLSLTVPILSVYCSGVSKTQVKQEVTNVIK